MAGGGNAGQGTGGGAVKMPYFEVQRATPGKRWSGTPVERNLRAALPFEIEVEPATPRGKYDSLCECQTVYRVTEASVEWLRKHELLRGHLVAPGAARPVVCLCIGRLVGE